MYARRVVFNLVKSCSIALSNVTKQEHYLYLCPIKKNDFSLFIFTNKLQYSTITSSKCWNCNAVNKSEWLCSKCKVLQEPSKNLTHFDLMGVQKNYNISIAELHNKYRELQKILHPDKFGNKSEKEKELSETLSSLVNKAYTTLSHPIKRGIYLLELNNESIPEKIDNNSEFLMEIMDKNDEIENAKEDKNAITKLVQQNKTTLDALAKDLEHAFKNEDTEMAKRVIQKMKFYDSIDGRLKKMKQDLGIVE